MTEFRKSRVVFRADASPTLGSGHIMRCLTLATALRDAGFSCGFSSNAEAQATVPALARSEFPVTASGEPLKNFWPDGCDLLVVDHYQLDAEWESEMRGWAKRVLVIDDLANRPHDCDLLLDQTPGRQGAYARLVPAGCQELLGPRFALLRPQFAAKRNEALARRGGPLRTVAIGFGSADPNDLTSLALEAIEASGLDVVVEVLLSASAPHIQRVRFLAAGLSSQVVVHVDVDCVAEIFARADLAIGAGGTSSWERCALGLPSLVVLIADNQRLIGETLNQCGAVSLVGWHPQVSVKELTTALTLLDNEARHRMATAAANVTDGEGVTRVVEALT